MKESMTKLLLVCLVATIAILATGISATAAIKWDWEYNQSDWIKKLYDDPLTANGICYALSYNWVKRGLKEEETNAKTYKKTKVFVPIARIYKQYHATYLLEKGKDGAHKFFKKMGMKKDGLKVTVAYGDSAWVFFKKDQYDKAAGMVAQLPDDFYMFGFRGPDQASHMCALQIKGKQIIFFDPNYGQFTASRKKFKKWLGALLSDEYGSWLGGAGDVKAAWQIVRVEIDDEKKFEKAPLTP
ncbi:YopT-type cysteine protease domain-containing protein [Planctomycetota bacterium]